MSYQYPLLSKYDHLLATAQAVALVVDEIDSLPATLKTLQGELSATNELIDLAQKSLVSEQAAFHAERVRALNDRRNDYQLHEQDQKDQLAHIAALRAEAVQLQNRAADERRRFDLLMKQYRQLERQLAYPTVPQSPEAIPPAVESSTQAKKEDRNGKAN
jgi:serine phosphatase RsbU (regulator of sigma subunit)